ncbi:MAG TPA: sigma-70 family RNA polymerase sigma factor [Verrucomicrobiae bacterium]|nr:sigma-70 family RNA polymerase sigma factor [Verrucomicrobiae bacterium]
MSLPIFRRPFNFYTNFSLAVSMDWMVNGQTGLDWRQQLYERQAAELILYGRALGLSHGEAEDVLQETFLALLRMPRPPREPEHYCLRSFRNRALNYRRSLWRRLTREWESRRWFERSPEESALERAAMCCLAELPVEQREVIVLKIWHDCTFEEIGGLLEISPHTAAGRWRYGLQKIKLRLEAMDNERERTEEAGASAAFLAAAPAIARA